MTLDLSNPLDRLYLECLPTRPTGDPNTLLGPTEQFRLLEVERERWLVAAEIGHDDELGAA